jgi:hypothetical protein
MVAIEGAKAYVVFFGMVRNVVQKRHTIPATRNGNADFFVSILCEIDLHKNNITPCPAMKILVKQT